MVSSFCTVQSMARLNGSPKMHGGPIRMEQYVHSVEDDNKTKYGSMLSQVVQPRLTRKFVLYQ